jgi:hypothetical protein
MSAVPDMSVGVLPPHEANSRIDRVRVRMTRLIHPGRDRPESPARPELPADRDQRTATLPLTAPTVVAESVLTSLVEDVRTLEQVIEDSENLIRQAWNVAADLNQVRRQCGRCESVGVLTEPLGTFQGLLNRCRHNLRRATASVDNIRAAVWAARRGA